MIRRITVVIAMVVALLATALPQAHAGLSSGACVIGLTFNFNGSVGLTTSPSFNFSGGGTCGATFAEGLLPGAPSTFISGSGSSIAWNCAGVVATGILDQQFSSSSPPPVTGAFRLAGANGAYVMEIDSLTSYVAVAQLTTVDAAAVGTCPINPVEQLTLVGVLEFQDP